MIRIQLLTRMERPVWAAPDLPDDLGQVLADDDLAQVLVGQIELL